MTLASSVYLENLEDFVHDQGLVVTYKWLSRQLGVPVNLAKQMLYAYHAASTTNAGAKGDAGSPEGGCTASYFLGGRLADGSGIAFRVVPEAGLETARSAFAEVTTEHVYSLQAAPLSDASSTLYTADYDQQRKHLGESNRWAAIRCAEAVRSAGAPTATNVVATGARGVSAPASAAAVDAEEAALRRAEADLPKAKGPQISKTAFFGKKRASPKSTATSKNAKGGCESSSTASLQKAAVAAAARATKAAVDQETTAKAAEVNKNTAADASAPRRIRRIMSSDEEESGDEGKAGASSPKKKAAPVKRKAEAPAPKPAATAAVDTQVAAPDGGPTLDEMIAAIPRCRTVEKQVKRHFQNGKYMQTEIVTETSEVELTEEEYQREVEKCKRRYAARIAPPKKVKKSAAAAGKAHGSSKKKQGSLMGFFKPK